MEGGDSLSKMMVPPKDWYNLAYVIHFLLGAGNLLPWNALITAVDYFSYLYPEKHVDKVFSVAYMGCSLPVLVGLICWTNRPSVRLRMNCGFAMFVLSLIMMPILDWTYIQGRQGLSGAYRVTVSMVVMCGVADGVVAGSLIGSTGELPERYMQAVFAGTATSGVLVSTLRLVTKASLPQTPQGLQASAHLYFIVSTSIVLICIICYNILNRLPIMKYYRGQKSVATETLTGNFKNPCPEAPKLPTRSNLNTNPKPNLLTGAFWAVWRRIRWVASGIVLIYVITLSIFPGYITEDVHSELLKDWYALLLITTYNVSDLVGKSLTALYVPKKAKKAVWACGARLLLYPFFAACLHGPKLFRTEIPVTTLTSILGVTNGYLTSVLMILGPKSVPLEEAEMAGLVMVLFLGLGLAGGSVLGWFWVI
ncbi:hypothetical protein AMTRI_Chr05g74370 [Amborella trichopoda]